ncbi:MAG: hypothetical protein ACOYON_11625 [Fimbriimonas sp.]
MNIKRTILMVAATVFAASSMAQGFPGGGGGFGGGQGRGMRMMGGGGGLQPAAALLAREDVQEDLKITDDQKTKLTGIQEEMQQQMMQQFQGFQGGGGGDREAMMAEMRKKMTTMMAEVTKKVNGVLDAGQQKRLKEISVQLAGNSAIRDKDIAKELAITPAQQTSIDALGKKSGEANQAVMAKARGGELEWAQVGEIMQKNTKALDAELGKLLTEVQKTKLKEMGGAPFKVKEEKGD